MNKCVNKTSKIKNQIKSYFFLSSLFLTIKMIIITKDLFQPATAKISFKDLKKIGQSPGSWVEVYSEQGKVKSKKKKIL